MKQDLAVYKRFWLCFLEKQGPQGPQKLSSIKSHKIQNPYRSELASLSNSGWQNHKEHHPQTTDIWPKQLNVTLSAIKWESLWLTPWLERNWASKNIVSTSLNVYKTSNISVLHKTWRKLHYCKHLLLSIMHWFRITFPFQTVVLYM